MNSPSPGFTTSDMCILHPWLSCSLSFRTFCANLSHWMHGFGSPYQRIGVYTCSWFLHSCEVITWSLLVPLASTSSSTFDRNDTKSSTIFFWLWVERYPHQWWTQRLWRLFIASATTLPVPWAETIKGSYLSKTSSHLCCVEFDCLLVKQRLSGFWSEKTVPGCPKRSFLITLQQAGALTWSCCSLTRYLLTGFSSFRKVKVTGWWSRHIAIAVPHLLCVENFPMVLWGECWNLAMFELESQSI